MIENQGGSRAGAVRQEQGGVRVGGPDVRWSELGSPSGAGRIDPCRTGTRTPRLAEQALADPQGSNQGRGTVHQEYIAPQVVTLAPRQNHRIEIKKLSYGHRGLSHRSFWLEPGNYTL